MKPSREILQTVPPEVLEGFRIDERMRAYTTAPILVDFTCLRQECRASFCLRWPWQSYNLSRLRNHRAEHVERQPELPGFARFGIRP